MGELSGYGAVVGSAVLVLSCIIGMVVFAQRTSGRARVFGILGCALILLARLVGTGLSFGMGLWAVLTTPTAIWIISVVTTVFTTAGLLSLGLSFLSFRGGSIRGDFSRGRCSQSEVGS